MTKVMRAKKPTSPVALLLGAAAGLALAMPVAAQPVEEAASEEQPRAAAQPAEEAVSEEQPAAAQPAEEPASVESPAAAPAPPAVAPPVGQPLQGQPAAATPPPALPPPPRYPFAYRPRPVEPTEAEGPITSWQPLRFAVALENHTSWLVDDGAQRVVGDKRAAAGGLSVQADVLRPRENVAVRLDLAWVKLSRSAYSSDRGLPEQLKRNVVALGIALRYHLLHWLAPYARVAGGLGWDRLTVADLRDRKLFGQGSVGAGLFLRSPGLHLWRGHAPALGLVGQLEGGYALASGSDFVLNADARSSSENPIPTTDVPLGHVARSVPYLRVSLGLAF